ncbi:hypothetical protein K504DRAFT_466490 [Pleomassaria siparia CBS 279.74]|uniref:Uncharacterized protein n=1 Tax=Pleomassaria siparia CBS 279.74 TaxID=1314801 RepID=A0A6G1KBB0_9PLEO|nr:hypothetical protein K504DRAFT_466490 [Pleomassaria siparia CBS 279.74]
MSRLASVVAAAAALLASSAAALPTWSTRDDTPSNATTPQNSSMVYDFADLPPSTELSWTPCWDKYLCSNLEVPLDYEDTTAGTTNVAFIKLSGGNGSATQDILFNPGGPGGSGVQTILSGLGDEILGYLGPNYNLVSFDPRGVNNTGPSVSCFPSPEIRATYAPPDPASDDRQYFANYKALGEYCTNTNANTTAKYVGTLAVVQDMMHFHELNVASKGGDPKTEGVWYYGVSYGTVIGHTLAATYPSRVGRIIVDGNVDSKEHYNGESSSSVEDTDQTFAFFFEYCFQAGPKCAFYGNSSSAADIRDRYLNMLQKLEDDPITIGDVPTIGPKIITRFGYESWAFNQVYQPMTGFPTVALVAAGLEKGNATLFLVASGEASASLGSATPYNSEYNSASEQEALTLISCIDANTRYPITNVSTWETAIEKTRRESIFAGDVLAHTNVIMCSGFGISPPTSQLFTFPKSAVKTSVPLLFVGNTGDPVTPVQSAVEMSKFFEGSVALTQNSPGHISIQTKSTCTKQYIQNYLETAALPEIGTTCELDVLPFQATKGW